MSTWLVTWETSNPELLPPKRVALVLNGRMGAEKVRKIVQALYASYSYSEAEMIPYRVETKNPYPAKFGDVGGVTYDGEITCGHNPFLAARLVDNLKSDASGNITWHERPRPTPRLP